MSSGSASELAYHLILARDLSYLPVTKFADLALRVVRVQKMLAGLISKISASKKSRAAGA
jgi:four helix bundle protein